MNFLESIFHRLSQTPERPVLREVREGAFVTVTCGELLAQIRAARAFVAGSGLKRGDRCGLLAHNGIRWAAVDLALMAEGVIVVPLYARQAPGEIAGMLRDCGAVMVICGDWSLRDELSRQWPDGPPMHIFFEVFRADPGQATEAPRTLAAGDLVTIIYTSGTSGEPKGVMLAVENLDHMVPCTGARLDLLMEGRGGPDQIFHYLPFCFAGSWILLLTALSRDSLLTMSTDLNQLAEEMKLAAPNYFLNVPALLERVRKGVEGKIAQRGGMAQRIFNKGRAAWLRRLDSPSQALDGLWLSLAESKVFPKIREQLGPNLKALICGSAPLARETQLFFQMIGIPVLQVYGLTETTAICTMDHPREVTAGCVGPAIPGVEMKLGDGDEILVRGLNLFAGYWNRPEATTKAFLDGWFRTGDQGAVGPDGNWRIVGRVKNLIVLSSGHNVAPEPIEEKLAQLLPGAQQVVVMGNGRSFLTALVTGAVSQEQAGRAVETVNAGMPHYKCLRGFHLHAEPLTIESGLLTANGKLRRDAIADYFRDSVEELYRTQKASA